MEKHRSEKISENQLDLVNPRAILLVINLLGQTAGADAMDTRKFFDACLIPCE